MQTDNKFLPPAPQPDEAQKNDLDAQGQAKKAVHPLAFMGLGKCPNGTASKTGGGQGESQTSPQAPGEPGGQGEPNNAPGQKLEQAEQTNGAGQTEGPTTGAEGGDEAAQEQPLRGGDGAVEVVLSESEGSELDIGFSGGDEAATGQVCRCRPCALFDLSWLAAVVVRVKHSLPLTVFDADQSCGCSVASRLHLHEPHGLLVRFPNCVGGSPSATAGKLLCGLITPATAKGCCCIGSGCPPHAVTLLTSVEGLCSIT